MQKPASFNIPEVRELHDLEGDLLLPVTVIDILDIGAQIPLHRGCDVVVVANDEAEDRIVCNFFSTALIADIVIW